MNDTQTYNGWTNYATWGVALVIDNDQATQEEKYAKVDAARRDGPASEQVAEGIWSPENATLYLLTDALKEWVEEMIDDGVHETHGPIFGDVSVLLARQIISAGLADVDWEEIARNALSD